MCYLLKTYFWWLLRRVKNLRSTACKHYRKCDVIYRYLHIESIWCLLMVQYLQNNVIMKWTTRFICFTDWIPLKYGSTTTPPIIAHCQKTPMSSLVSSLRISHCDSQNLQYKTHPEFWPSHRRIFKTSLYYKTRLILETRQHNSIARIDRQFNNGYSKFTIMYGYPWFNYGYPERYAGKISDIHNWIVGVIDYEYP